MTIQFAAEEDTGLILRFIKELADYEGMLSEVEGNSERSESDGEDERHAYAGQGKN